MAGRIQEELSSAGGAKEVAQGVRAGERERSLHAWMGKLASETLRGVFWICFAVDVI